MITPEYHFGDLSPEQIRTEVLAQIAALKAKLEALASEREEIESRLEELQQLYRKTVAALTTVPVTLENMDPTTVNFIHVQDIISNQPEVATTTLGNHPDTLILEHSIHRKESDTGLRLGDESERVYDPVGEICFPGLGRKNIQVLQDWEATQQHFRERASLSVFSIRVFPPKLRPLIACAWINERLRPNSDPKGDYEDQIDAFVQALYTSDPKPEAALELLPASDIRDRVMHFLEWNPASLKREEIIKNELKTVASGDVILLTEGTVVQVLETNGENIILLERLSEEEGTEEKSYNISQADLAGNVAAVLESEHVVVLDQLSPLSDDVWQTARKGVGLFGKAQTVHYYVPIKHSKIGEKSVAAGLGLLRIAQLASRRQVRREGVPLDTLLVTSKKDNQTFLLKREHIMSIKPTE